MGTDIGFGSLDLLVLWFAAIGRRFALIFATLYPFPGERSAPS
jgi:hypothetical protein